jgi:hypothetical protein
MEKDKPSVCFLCGVVIPEGAVALCPKHIESEERKKSLFEIDA